MTTPVTITIGSTVIHASLNDTVAGRALAKQLPYMVSGTRAQYDYCCVAKESLPTDPAELQDGWTNGDILHGGGWFSILFDGEKQSKSYTDLMIVGRIDEGYLDKVKKLGSSITLTMARA